MTKTERFTVKLANGSYVSSPTDKTTTNPNFAGVFDSKAQAEAAAAFHGGGTLVPFVAPKFF